MQNLISSDTNVHLRISGEEIDDLFNTTIRLIQMGNVAVFARDNKPVAAMISIEDLLTHPAFKKTARKLKGDH